MQTYKLLLIFTSFSSYTGQSVAIHTQLMDQNYESIEDCLDAGKQFVNYQQGKADCKISYGPVPNRKPY